MLAGLVAVNLHSKRSKVSNCVNSKIKRDLESLFNRGFGKVTSSCKSLSKIWWLLFLSGLLSLQRASSPGSNRAIAAFKI